MIEIFRLEHRDTRKGPFQTNTPFMQDLAHKATHAEGLKTPYQDGLGLADIPWIYVFGAPSLDALKRWVLLGADAGENQYIVQTLHAEGFVVAQYLVEDDYYLMGRSTLQVAFDAGSARREGLVSYEDVFSLLPQASGQSCSKGSAIEVCAA